MARGTCGDCAHSPSLSTKTSCSRFRSTLGEFLVDLVLDVQILGVLHVLLTLSLRLLTSLLVLLLPAVGDALLLPAVGFALVLPAVGFALSLLFIIPALLVHLSF